MADRCDICGKTDPDVCYLRQQYTTSLIRKLCPDCMRLANDRIELLHKTYARAKEDEFKNFLVLLKHRGPKSFISRWATTILRLLRL